MQINVTVRQTAEVTLWDIGDAILQFLLADLPGTEQDAWHAGANWYTDGDGHVYVDGNPAWEPFPANPETVALVDAINVLMGHGLLKMPADPKPTLYEAYPAECPNGHDGATYVPEIEAVRCPVCGLSDVSA